jgi:peptide deformylase
MRAIRQLGDPALRTVCSPVTEFGEPVRNLVREMFESMRGHQVKGVGLAANQIGDFRRVIVIDMSGRGADELVMVNPVIVRADGTQQVNDGCLSIDKGRRFGRTTRAARIRVTYQDQDGNAMKRKAAGDLAHCIQHEIDHLDGILWIDKQEGAGE